MIGTTPWHGWADHYPRRRQEGMGVFDQLVEDWDYYWMEFECDKQTTDDGLECYYYTPFPRSGRQLDGLP